VLSWRRHLVSVDFRGVSDEVDGKGVRDCGVDMLEGGPLFVGPIKWEDTKADMTLKRWGYLRRGRRRGQCANTD
jgi:hypothetical protein